MDSQKKSAKDTTQNDNVEIKNDNGNASPTDETPENNTIKEEKPIVEKNEEKNDNGNASVTDNGEKKSDFLNIMDDFLKKPENTKKDLEKTNSSSAVVNTISLM